RLVHHLLDDAKYFGAFYTTVPAAALLLTMALDPSAARIDWHDAAALGQLRVADLACGTGTLLKAPLHTVVHNHLPPAVHPPPIPTPCIARSPSTCCGGWTSRRSPSIWAPPASRCTTPSSGSSERT